MRLILIISFMYYNGQQYVLTTDFIDKLSSNVHSLIYWIGVFICKLRKCLRSASGPVAKTTVPSDTANIGYHNLSLTLEQCSLDINELVVCILHFYL